VTRQAQTREEAFKRAHALLDEAEDRQWFKGEGLAVRIEQAEG
jgi:hypothetical protein